MPPGRLFLVNKYFYHYYQQAYSKLMENFPLFKQKAKME